MQAYESLHYAVVQRCCDEQGCGGQDDDLDTTQEAKEVHKETQLVVQARHTVKVQKRKLKAQMEALQAKMDDLQLDMCSSHLSGE